MELYQLRTFVTVADTGNLTQAAERLFTSQPAVSSCNTQVESGPIAGLLLSSTTTAGGFASLVEVPLDLFVLLVSPLLEAQLMLLPRPGLTPSPAPPRVCRGPEALPRARLQQRPLCAPSAVAPRLPPRGVLPAPREWGVGKFDRSRCESLDCYYCCA